MNNNNDIVISTKNLSKVYKLYKNPKDRLKEALSLSGKVYHKDFYALKNINLEIRRGEVIGIVGKNGSGKSTLLKILSRVLTPTSGEFMVKGKVSSLLELGSGFNPELTGIENIFFYATILGIEEKKIKEKLQEILDFADIGDFVYQPLKTYSSGMKARLAFSVAINVDPDILILDEVLAVGDELFRRKCYAKMENFFKGQKTILFVSHSVSDINQLCTRSIMIDKGQFIIEGPSKLVTAQYQRYLFALPENASKILQEIKIINGDTELKNVTYAELFKVRKNKQSEEPALKNKETENTEKIEQVEKIDKPKALYIPGMEPKSRVEYKNFNVDITDICITTLHGKKVNALITGDRYIYSYRVKFNIDASEIVFGMKLKNEKGMHLSAAMSNNQGVYLAQASKGDVYVARCLFTCNLLFGTYYTNAGVAVSINGKHEYLNRIVDALVFKVQRSNENIGGFVFTDNKFEIKQFG